jgi:hypothetical protein
MVSNSETIHKRGSRKSVLMSAKRTYQAFAWELYSPHPPNVALRFSSLASKRLTLSLASAHASS